MRRRRIIRDNVFLRRYLLSGGVSMRAVVPEMTLSFRRWIEARLSGCAGLLARFARIVLARCDSAGHAQGDVLHGATSSDHADLEGSRL